MMIWLAYFTPELSLSRHSGSVPWGFTLAGGQDQALTIKVGCVLQVRNSVNSSLNHSITNHKSHSNYHICQESVAETCGLRTRDFIWKVNDAEVFNKSHSECVKMIKASGRLGEGGGDGSKVSYLTGNTLRLTVERGDHIVPSFQEISGRSKTNPATTALASQRRKDL